MIDIAFFSNSKGGHLGSKGGKCPLPPPPLNKTLLFYSHMCTLLPSLSHTAPVSNTQGSVGVLGMRTLPEPFKAHKVKVVCWYIYYICAHFHKAHRTIYNKWQLCANSISVHGRALIIRVNHIHSQKVYSAIEKHLQHTYSFY